MHSPDAWELMSSRCDEANVMVLARIWTTNMMFTIDKPRSQVTVVKDQKGRAVLEPSKR